jgi:hypothetical protein
MRLLLAAALLCVGVGATAQPPDLTKYGVEAGSPAERAFDQQVKAVSKALEVYCPAQRQTCVRTPPQALLDQAERLGLIRRGLLGGSSPPQRLPCMIVGMGEGDALVTCPDR